MEQNGKAPDGTVDLAEIFGLTPAADAYARQLTELRGIAAKASRMAGKAALDAQDARVTVERVKALADDLALAQKQYAATADRISAASVFIAACALLVLLCTVIGIFV